MLYKCVIKSLSFYCFIFYCLTGAEPLNPCHMKWHWTELVFVKSQMFAL